MRYDREFLKKLKYVKKFYYETDKSLFMYNYLIFDSKRFNNWIEEEYVILKMLELEINSKKG